MTTTSAIGRPDAREIARLVSVPQLLRHHGWRTRHRGRADCGLCRGSSTGTVSYREHVWHCHRCGAGGDVYSFVGAVQGCDFAAALRYVAEMAGVKLECSTSSNTRRMAERHRQRERIETAAATLGAMECDLRMDYRDRIHRAERRTAELSVQSVWAEKDWILASVCSGTLRRDLAAYALLSFCAPADRARFVLHPEGRHEMIWGALLAGGLRDGNGRWVEVPA